MTDMVADLGYLLSLVHIMKKKYKIKVYKIQYLGNIYSTIGINVKIQPKHETLPYK